MIEIALYQPDIAPNAATILRMCACFGLTCRIIEPAGFVLTDSAFRRAGMDYLDRAAMISDTSWTTFRIPARRHHPHGARKRRCAGGRSRRGGGSRGDSHAAGTALNQRRTGLRDGHGRGAAAARRVPGYFVSLSFVSEAPMSLNAVSNSAALSAT